VSVFHWNIDVFSPRVSQTVPSIDACNASVIGSIPRESKNW